MVFVVIAVDSIAALRH